MASNLLPILNNPSSTTHTCGTGGCGSCATERTSEQVKKLEKLAEELRQIVLRSRPPVVPLHASPPTPPQGHSRGKDREEKSTSRVGTVTLQGQKAEHTFSMHQPLPLVSQLYHRPASDNHVWVAVLEAGVIVLNEGDNDIMTRLERREPLASIVQALQPFATMDSDLAWARVSRLIGRLARAGFIQGVKGYNEEPRLPAPGRYSRFHLTKACQLECIHCYADSSPYVDRSGELPTTRWIRLAEDFAANGGRRVLFTGGEALIHKGCVEIMEFAKSLGLYVTLFTNGILVPRYSREIANLADKVQVSLDGPDEATNDAIRGRGTYKKILRALDILLGQGTRTQVGMSIMEQNWESWKAGFLSFSERYAHAPLEFHIGFGITQYGRATNFADELAIEETQPVVEKFLAHVNGQNGPRITRATKGCGYCEQLVVGPDGTVYPCHLLDGPVCHIDDHPLPEITKMLGNMATFFDVDHVAGCDACEIRYLCGGTCRVVDGRNSGTRLMTTCTKTDKDRRYSNLVQLYSQQSRSQVALTQMNLQEGEDTWQE